MPFLVLNEFYYLLKVCDVLNICGANKLTSTVDFPMWLKVCDELNIWGANKLTSTVEFPMWYREDGFNASQTL